MSATVQTQNYEIIYVINLLEQSGLNSISLRIYKDILSSVSADSCAEERQATYWFLKEFYDRVKHIISDDKRHATVSRLRELQ